MSAQLEEIRRLYFETTKGSILKDFDRAIDLLKSLETPDERQKATVYMSGLAEMRKEWGAHKPAGGGPPRRTGKPRS
ncbi:MAG: hypothetical protein WD690_05400 [Vicinamibacterales bacterium]